MTKPNLEDIYQAEKSKEDLKKEIQQQQKSMLARYERAYELHCAILKSFGVAVLIEPGRVVSLNFGYRVVYFSLEGKTLKARYNPVERMVPNPNTRIEIGNDVYSIANIDSILDLKIWLDRVDEIAEQYREEILLGMKMKEVEPNNTHRGFTDKSSAF